MKELTLYINEISKTPVDNYGLYPSYNEWTFYGDGDGDFEQISHRIPDKQLLLDYQKYLKHQYNLVREAIILVEATEENYDGII